MYDIILSFITALLLTYIAIPSIIKIARDKNLFDEPGERAAHTENVPTLGGIAIFAGVVFAITFWTPFNIFSGLQYILCAFIIVFLIGAKDDIVPLTASKKFGGQVLAALILVFQADIRLTHMHGMFGIEELSYLGSILLSMFTIILLINAFNLIDGINGLLGSITAVITVTFGLWFYVNENIDLAVMAFALLGALVAFLKYNFTPARIFMGDTGSLLLGFVCSILSIKFIELNKEMNHDYSIESAPAIAIAIMIIPLFDTLRVFILRTLKGSSPFAPDKKHIHHFLLKAGCSHMRATAILVAVNIFFIIFSYFLRSIGSFWLLIIMLIVANLLMYALLLVVRKQNQNSSI